MGGGTVGAPAPAAAPASGVDLTTKPADISGSLNVNTVMGVNALGNFGNMALDAWKTSLNYDLMSNMLGMQTTQMTKHFELQGRLVDLNGSLITSQEKIAIKQLNTTEKIAELQKDRDVAVAKTKAEAAVKIAKVNALNAQFYGQPANNRLPNIG